MTGKAEAADFESAEKIVSELKRDKCVLEAETTNQRKGRSDRVEFSFSAKISCPLGQVPGMDLAAVAAGPTLPGAPSAPVPPIEAVPVPAPTPPPISAIPVPPPTFPPGLGRPRGFGPMPLPAAMVGGDPSTDPAAVRPPGRMPRAPMRMPMRPLPNGMPQSGTQPPMPTPPQGEP
jgi:hypothetical protein